VRGDLIRSLGAEPRFTATGLAHALEPVAAEPRQAYDTHEDAAPATAGSDLASREAPDVATVESSSESVDDGEGAQRWMRSFKASTALGIAVHAVLESVDLRTLADLDGLAVLAASANGVEPRAAEVARLARAAAESPVVRAAVAGRFWREVPVGASHEGVLLEGFIDLLYERPDGTLGIIDYKTDRVSPAHLAQRAAQYRLQGGAYALAIEAATGRHVRSVDYVFASLGETVTFTDVVEMVAAVRAGLTASSG
jgi:ATP-dependent exoDNAse (exonuclease V) beta subunit